MSHKTHDKTRMNGKPGVPSSTFTVRFFGGLWRWEAAAPNGKIGEGFRSSKADAEAAAQDWIKEQK